MNGYEYFRRGNGSVWHVARAFSHLPLPERNSGKALCGYAVANRFESVADLPNGATLCGTCEAQRNAHIMLGTTPEQEAIREVDAALTELAASMPLTMQCDGCKFVWDVAKRGAGVCPSCGHKDTGDFVVMAGATTPEPEETPSYSCLYCRDTGRHPVTGFPCLHCEPGIALQNKQLERARNERDAYLRLRYGTCSERECREPTVGWCDTCDRAGVRAPKLCARHLQQHMSLKAKYPHISWLYETSLAPRE